jgi:hypothetical protein
MKWEQQIAKMASKASQMLGMLRRNIAQAPVHAKLMAFFSLVRSRLEYAAAVWDPYLKQDIKCLERIQNRATHFIFSDWETGSQHLKERLNLLDLAERRRQYRHCLLGKYNKGEIKIPNLPVIGTHDLPWVIPRWKPGRGELENLFFYKTL